MSASHVEIPLRLRTRPAHGMMHATLDALLDEADRVSRDCLDALRLTPPEQHARIGVVLDDDGRGWLVCTVRP